MIQDFNILFEKWKNKDLLEWIKEYENKLYKSENNINKSFTKEVLEQVYNNSQNIRNYFFNNYLTEISDNLNKKSDKDNYEYIDFFRQISPIKTRKKY